MENLKTKSPGHRSDRPWTEVFSYGSMLIICLILSSCVPCYYTPNAQNVPLFREKNDLNFMGAFRFSAESLGADVQMAHALTNHFAWMINYNHWGAKWDGERFGSDEEGSHSGDLFEFGLGYFTKLSEKAVFETYGGFGWAWVKNVYKPMSESKIDGPRYFIQPGFGWHLQHAKLGVSMRFAGLNHMNFEYRGIDTPSEGLQNVIDRPLSMFFEPAFTARFGKEPVMFHLQVVLSLPMNWEPIEYDPINISLGLIFPLSVKNEAAP
jgi:hypothetical protein